MSNESFCFDDLLLVPNYSNIESRKEIILTSKLNRISTSFSLPIIASPMDTITEDRMGNAMAQEGCLGIIHRYNSIEEQANFAKKVCKRNDAYCAAAVGVTGDFLERAQEMRSVGVRVICVDIAHGHHVAMKRALGLLREKLGEDVHLMAGNVATLAGFDDLADWGADSVRVGIGGGSICSTRIQTGHGIPTLQSIIDCARSHKNISLIADGGIRTSGDIVKALAAGADFVMLGSLLAGTAETPGDIVYKDRIPHKVYRGMASVEAQIDWRGHSSSEEGVSSMVPRQGPVRDVLNGLEKGIRSGLSYSGVRTIAELQAKGKFISQSSAGMAESSTHIKKMNRHK